MKTFTSRLLCCLALLLSFSSFCFAQSYPQPVPGDFIMRDFKFQSGETLPELKLHYATLGQAVKNKRQRCDVAKQRS